MSYRVIERTLCGGRDLYSSASMLEVAVWLIENGYEKGYKAECADIYIRLPDGHHIETSQILPWLDKVLKRRWRDKVQQWVFRD